MRAGEFGVERMLCARVQIQHQGAPVSQTQGGFHALGNALQHVGAHFEPVDHHINIVFFVFHQRRQIGQLDDFAINPETHKTLRLHLREHFGEFTFAFARHRRHQQYAGLCRQGQHRVHHLRHAGGLQRHAVFRAMRCARAREQQTQVIVNFGDGADSGARVVAGGFLLDGNRR